MLTKKPPPTNFVKNRIKRVKKQLTWLFEQATWRIRPLPDFIIIGAMKSGTTSLFTYLQQHPQLFPSSIKETKFFINPDRFAKGQAWYRAHFPLTRQISIGAKTYEASPGYIFNPLAPKRIFELIPKVKIIAVLRNPTERAISHYFHEKRKGRESLPIDKALQEEEKRLEQAIKTKDYFSEAYLHCSYKRRGIYKEQIEWYLNYFPSQKILIFSSNELFVEPGNCLKRIFDFVGVDREFEIKDLVPCNVASNKSKVDASVYEYLNNYFMQHNEELYELIGKNYTW